MYSFTTYMNVDVDLISPRLLLPLHKLAAISNSLPIIIFIQQTQDMAENTGPSWADQWDTGDQADLAKKNKKSGAGLKKGLEKTKAVASSGLKKVKEGSSTGFQWIKDKWPKGTDKH
ncbi:hypothetical protein OPV22_031042 [Ensete ventricosum]|uniref:Uncharacterized protein n=1 Tax=Ensete ventricosum TaxID=4639 RepID=A0AAV8PK61_ENSVE|nr:hypothetical protein OPV22_031042 [Ensete ventricosum]